jgi:hypothetical protein
LVTEVAGMDTPKNWRERSGRDPEKAAARLRERFAAVSRRYEQRRASRRGGRASPRWERLLGIAAVVVIVLGLLWLSRAHGLS